MPEFKCEDCNFKTWNAWLLKQHVEEEHSGYEDTEGQLDNEYEEEEEWY